MGRGGGRCYESLEDAHRQNADIFLVEDVEHRLWLRVPHASVAANG